MSNLNPGEKAIVRSLSGSGSIKRKLLEMGITPGTEIEVIRVAPLGDPIEVKIRGYSLSLRKEEANFVEIEEE